MRTKQFSGVLALLALALLTGCVGTVDGRKQWGSPFGKDHYEGRYERGTKEVWVAAKDVLSYLGTLTAEDTMRNVLQANIDTRTVWVLVEPVDEKLTRVLVQARTKGGGADLQLAAFVDKQIAVRLTAGTLTPAIRGKRGY